jgi:hypothetical protein
MRDSAPTKVALYSVVKKISVAEQQRAEQSSRFFIGIIK